jgi:hypothetical protein
VFKGSIERWNHALVCGNLKKRGLVQPSAKAEIKIHVYLNFGQQMRQQISATACFSSRSLRSRSPKPNACDQTLRSSIFFPLHFSQSITLLLVFDSFGNTLSGNLLLRTL